MNQYDGEQQWLEPGGWDSWQMPGFNPQAQLAALLQALQQTSPAMAPPQQQIPAPPPWESLQPGDPVVSPSLQPTQSPETQQPLQIAGEDWQTPSYSPQEQPAPQVAALLQALQQNLQPAQPPQSPPPPAQPIPPPPQPPPQETPQPQQIPQAPPQQQIPQPPSWESLPPPQPPPEAPPPPSLPPMQRQGPQQQLLEPNNGEGAQMPSYSAQTQQNPQLAALLQALQQNLHLAPTQPPQASLQPSDPVPAPSLQSSSLPPGWEANNGAHIQEGGENSGALLPGLTADRISPQVLAQLGFQSPDTGNTSIGADGQYASQQANLPALEKWMADKGYSVAQNPGAEQMGLMQNGQLLPQTQTSTKDDSNAFWLAAMMAAGVVGGGVAGMGGDAGALGASSTPAPDAWTQMIGDGQSSLVNPTADTWAQTLAEGTPNTVANTGYGSIAGNSAALGTESSTLPAGLTAGDIAAGVGGTGLTMSQLGSGATSAAGGSGGGISSLFNSAGQYLADNPTIGRVAGNLALGAGASALAKGVSGASGGGGMPAVPDYSALFSQQAQLQQQAQQQAIQANRVNTTTPYGSQTFGQVNDPTVPGGIRYTQNISLAPEQQKLLDANTALQNQQAGLLSSAGQRVGNSLSQPFSLAGQPRLQTAGQAPQFQVGNNRAQFETPTFDPNSMHALSGLSAPGNQIGDYGADTKSQIAQLLGKIGAPGQYSQSAADAVYNAQKRYSDTSFGQQQTALESRLGDQGFVPGTPAYSQAMNNFRDTRNRAEQTMQDSATTQGFNVGNQQYAQNLAGVNTGLSGVMQGANFGLTNDTARGNEARANVTQDASLQNQQFNQGGNIQDRIAQALTARNAVSQEGFLDNISQQNSNNSAMGQQAAANINFASQNNQARTQGINESLAMRNQPLNEMTALRNGTNVTNPTLPSMYTANQTQPGNPMEAANMNYNAQMGQSNARTASSNNLQNNMFGLAGAALNSGNGASNGKSSNPWLSNMFTGMGSWFGG